MPLINLTAILRGANSIKSFLRELFSPSFRRPSNRGKKLFFPRLTFRARVFIAVPLTLLFSFWQVNALSAAATVVKTISPQFCGEEGPPRCLIPHSELFRPKIGLVLSGGGLRGVAQIGALKVLEENNIPIDYIVGTSIGSIVGGLYASGYSPEEIWQITRSIRWNELLRDAPQRSAQFLGEKQKRGRAILQFRLQGFDIALPEAFTPGQKLLDILTGLVLNAPYHSLDFSQLRVPLRVVTTDILSGKKVVIDHGDLAEAMRASIAIPLLFSPVEMDSVVLADGGLTDNIPVDEAKKLGADIVLAVNTTSLLRNKDDMQAPWQIADQVTTIMQQRHNQEQLAHADLVIGFEDIETSSTDDDSIDQFYQEGQRRMRMRIDSIRQRLLPAAPADKPNRSFWIHQVIIDPPGEADLTDLVDTWANRQIGESEIANTLYRAYSTGGLATAFAEIVADGPDTLLYYRFIANPILEEVSFSGNSVMPDSFLRTSFLPLLDKPINIRQSKEAVKEIVRLYRAKGYSLAEVTGIDFSHADHRAYIHISEGKIASIRFSGNEKTKNFVIAREFSLQRDSLFQLSNAKQAVNNVFGTGLFSSVFLKTYPSSQGWKILLDLHENPTMVLRLGAHYDRERKQRAFIEVADENILGSGNDLTLHGQYGSRDAVAAMDFRADRIFKTYLTAQVRIHHQSSKHFFYTGFNRVGEYQRRASGAVFNLGQQIARFGTLSAVMRIEKIGIRSISGFGYDPGMLTIHTLGLNSEIDTRDQVPFPRSGKFHKFYYEVSSGTFLGADISYFKVQNQLATYWTFRERNTICPKLIWGTSDLTTPFSEYFRFGGEESFYGLREGELQGRHMLLFSLEYRYFLPKKWLFDMYLSARYDVGAAWESAVDVQPIDFINGKGIALSFKSPLGPLSVSYGAASNGKRRLYFTAGYDF